MSENAIDPLGPGILAGRRDAIVGLRSPLITDLRFEWHRSPSKVYVVFRGTPQRPVDRAELIAEHVNSEEEYTRLAGCFIRGWRAGHARAAAGGVEPARPGPIMRPVRAAG